MPDLGIRLRLMIGSATVAPAPYELMDALRDITVQINDNQRDAFQMNFTLGRRGAVRDYPLLRDGQLDPPNRVTIIVVIRALPVVLINGVITRHQVIPSGRAGQSQLHVFGEDLSEQLDRQGRRVTFENMSDSAIVEEILRGYPTLGLTANVTSTSDTPPVTQRINSQQETDLAMITRLAERNSYRFYLEPTQVPGRSTAYWGPRDRPGLPVQTALTYNMGTQDNVQQLQFGFDARAAVTPQATIIDSSNGQNTPVSALDSPDAALSSRPASALRTVPLSNTAGLDQTQAGLRMRSAASRGSSSADASGQLDTVRYGGILRARQKVEVRGVGSTQDGEYYVTQVTHNIRRGSYTQGFTLNREGRGATRSTVRGVE
jgi:phage protein D